jgi:hypothetical protein
VQLQLQQTKEAGGIINKWFASTCLAKYSSSKLARGISVIDAPAVLAAAVAAAIAAALGGRCPSIAVGQPRILA